MKRNFKVNIKRWAIRSAKIAFILVALLVVGYFSFRNLLLEKVVAKIKNKTQTEYNSTFSVKEAKFRSVGGIDMTDVALVPNDADSLLRVQSIKADINIMKLLVGDIQLEDLELKNGFVQLVKKDSVKNFDAFIKNKKDTVEVAIPSGKKDYARKTYRVLSRLLNLVPTDMKLANLELRVND